MYLHYCDSHVKKNRFFVNASELTMLMDSSNISSFSFVSYMPIKETKREGCQTLGSGVCVFRESMAAPWAACNEVRRECRRRNSEEASPTSGESYSRTSASCTAVISSNFNSSFGNYLAMRLVTPLVSNIWKDLPAFHLCVFTCGSLRCSQRLELVVLSTAAKERCPLELSEGECLILGRSVFSVLSLPSQSLGNLFWERQHCCYEWTLLLPKYDCLSGANQWQQDDLCEWMEQKAICLIELVQLFFLMKQHDYNLPTKVHKQLE